MDAPRTEAAFAPALPLDGLDAWRIYLGLPLSGSRLPAGGAEEVQRLGCSDAVLNLHGPVATQAAAELDPVLVELRERLELGDGPLALVGGSIGAAVAQLVLAEGTVGVRAAVLVSPVVQLRPVVDTVAEQYGFTYTWADTSLAVAARLDFVARAGEIAGRGQPAVLAVVGEDDAAAIVVSAELLRDALTVAYDDPSRVGLVTVVGMAHALAEEPDELPAPQTPHAAVVDSHAVTWLRQHLTRDDAAFITGVNLPVDGGLGASNGQPRMS